MNKFRGGLKIMAGSSYTYFPEHRCTGQSGFFLDQCVNGQVVTDVNRAFLGDEVYYEGGRITGIKTRRKVHVAGLLLLPSLKKYGKTARGLPVYKMIPLSSKYPPMYVASSHRDVSQNVYALVEFKEWTAQQKYPHMNLVRILGGQQDPLAENLALLHKNEVYRKPLADGADGADGLEEGADGADRMTYPLACGITCIDPVGSDDLDDAFHVEGNTVYVHIADVDYYIRQGVPLDRLLADRVTSIYGPALSHMLPERYARELISLKPNGRKAAMTVTFTQENDQPLTPISITPTFVYPQRALSYDAAQKLLEGGDPTLQTVSRLTGQTDTHKIIETLMIACNAYIGDVMAKAGQGLIRTCAAGSRAQYVPVCPVCPVHPVHPVCRHESLNLENYTHFTSPIRRYADVLVGRIVKHLINPRDKASVGPYGTADISAACTKINAYGVKVSRYYRDADIVRLYQFVHSKGGLYRTTGVFLAYDLEHAELRVGISEGDLDLEYAYRQSEIHPRQPLPPLGSTVAIVLRTDSHEIKLKRRVIMHLAL